MFIDTNTLLRVNINLPYGQFSKLDTPAIREMAGVIEIADPQKPIDFSDEEFIWDELDYAPYFRITPRDPEQVARSRQEKINAQSLQHLVDTDWYVTRSAETAVAIPDEIKLSRQAARDAIVRLTYGPN